MKEKYKKFEFKEKQSVLKNKKWNILEKIKSKISNSKKQKKYLIIRQRKDDYFLKYIKDKNLYNMYQEELNWNDILVWYQSIGTNKVNDDNCIFSDWKNKIIESDICILFDTGYEKKIGEYIKEKNKNIKVVIFFWNSITENNEWILSDENIDEFYTFDKENVKKYNLKYNHQFYINDISLNNTNIENDIVFLGNNKGRKEFIYNLKEDFDNLGLKSDIIIIDNQKDYIDYSTYLDMLFKSKCVLEILIDTQHGLSLRTMESIFFNKKLITNNLDIVNYDFYNKNNIFIIGKDDINDLPMFLNSDYHNIDKNILKKYTYEDWLNNFGIKYQGGTNEE